MIKSFFKSEFCFLCTLIRWFREKYSKNSGMYSFYTKWRIYVWKGLNLVGLLISYTGRWLNLFSLKWVLFPVYFLRWFREKYSKNSGMYSFYTKLRIYVWKGLSLVGLLISNTDRWLNLFSLKWVLFPGKILKKFWHVGAYSFYTKWRIYVWKAWSFFYK